MAILFRTKKYIQRGAFGSHKLTNIQWTDWSDITLYEHWDVRDIIWKKWIWNDTLYRKKREEYARIELIICETSSPGDFFYQTSQSECRYTYKQLIREQLKKSAHQLWVWCQYMFLADPHDIRKKIFQKEIKNSLFCVLCSYEDLSSLIPLYTQIGKVNDIVFIVVCHPFEIHPESPMIFLWKYFGNNGHIYRENLGKQERKDILLSGMEMVELQTNENIEKKLNFFFKKRILYV